MKLRRIRKIALSLSLLLLLTGIPISRPVSASALNLELNPVRNLEDLIIKDPVITPGDDLIIKDPFPGGGGMVTPMATYINQISVSLSIPASRLATITAIAHVYNNLTMYMEVTLQKKVLLWWTDVATFKHYGKDLFATTNRYSVQQSGTYRAKVSVTVNAETLSVTSGEVKVP